LEASVCFRVAVHDLQLLYILVLLFTPADFPIEGELLHILVLLFTSADFPIEGELLYILVLLFTSADFPIEGTYTHSGQLLSLVEC
jgi:hypothetical protein